MQNRLRNTRRQFLTQSLAIAGILATTLRSSPGMANQDKPPRKFDIHTHLGQTWNTTEVLRGEDLLRWMDAHDIEQAAVLPLVSPESSSYLLTSDFVLSETKPHRDRLVPFCCLDPRTSYSGGVKGAVEMLRRWVNAGARGFGEHKPGVAIDDARSMKLYEACGELKLPVLFHCDNQRNTDAPGLPGLAKVLAAFPNVNFIGHAQGWWASISGGVKQADLDRYPKEQVQPGGAIDALMEKFPNIYGDLSAGSGANAIARDRQFGREFLIRRADRLLFGTDFLAPQQAVPQFELFEDLKLPPEVLAKIYQANAQRLLHQAAAPASATE
jgi:predicted TIM-barrel fold metal-dependent hydrolase